MKKFKVLTVGWEPTFVQYLLPQIAARAGIEFTHGIVGDARRLAITRQEFPHFKWVALSKTPAEPLPVPDYDLLASMESVGIPTVRSMIRGDRVLRHRPSEEALGYATLLTRRIAQAIDETGPDVVLGSNDSIHAALGLAVARSRGIPWVALAFTVIPDDLSGFIRGLTPEQLVPLERPVDENLRREALEVLSSYRQKSVKILAYHAPDSFAQRIHQLELHGRNLVRRIANASSMGVDRFTFPTAGERLTDLARRSRNRLRLQTETMLQSPPESRFVFFPLHMAPESSVDTWAPLYQNQLELAFQMSLAVPADMEVVVKLHFSDPDNYAPDQLQRLMQLPRVRIAHPCSASRSFIEQAALVIGIQGTASLEAALLGKPVLMFGDSPYVHFPRSERARRPDELHAQILRMRSLTLPSEGEIVEAFAAYMSRYMPGRINDWNTPIEEKEFDRMANCFRSLRSYVESPGVREAWYQQPPFLGNE